MLISVVTLGESIDFVAQLSHTLNEVLGPRKPGILSIPHIL